LDTVRNPSAIAFGINVGLYEDYDSATRRPGDLSEARGHVLKTKSAEPQRRPKNHKLKYKNRWLISRDVVAHLRRAGVDCNIIVPERIALTEEGLLSPGERAAMALINSGVRADVILCPQRDAPWPCARCRGIVEPDCRPR
jgi:hypothetical protein